MDRDLDKILKRLEEAGFEAYIVGGSVRDDYLGIPPKDIDIASSARPEEVEALFRDYKTLDIGKKYGTISLVLGQEKIEITTFRHDLAYKDHRHPEGVRFTDSLLEDLKRRDFTMNAMAKNRQGEIFDPFHGREDLDRGILKMVGNPMDRLEEDALRILRGFRFASRFKLNLDPDFLDAASLCKEGLARVSRDRIRQEFFGLLLTDQPSYGLLLMEETGVLKILFPDLMATVGFDQKNPYHSQTLFDHLLCVLDHTPAKLSTRLAALFHDIAKPQKAFYGKDGHLHFYDHDKEGALEADQILKDLGAGKKLRASVRALIQDHMTVQKVMTDKALRRQIKRVGRENVLDLYDLILADAACTAGPGSLAPLRARKARILDLLDEDLTKKENFLAMNGHDLMDLGYKKGPLLGAILRACQDLVLEDPEKNTQEDLKKYVEERFKKQS